MASGRLRLQLLGFFLDLLGFAPHAQNFVLELLHPLLGFALVLPRALLDLLDLDLDLDPAPRTGRQLSVAPSGALYDTNQTTTVATEATIKNDQTPTGLHGTAMIQAGPGAWW